MSRKTLIIADDENEADLNPFSFRQFLRSKSQDPEEDRDRDPDRDRDRDRDGAHVIGDAAREWGLEGRGRRGASSSSEQVGEEPEVTSSGQVTPTCVKLQQENRKLKETITELQREIHRHERRAAHLSQRLSEQQRREEKEAGVLEDVVQSVEQNLDLMTKRAQKSEGHVTKLKGEVKQLQSQVRSLQQDNERLKSAHSDVVTAMRHNAHLASEYLSKTVSHAHSSLRRLQDEAETLQLISQLLLSIDRISEPTPPTHPEHAL